MFTPDPDDPAAVADFLVEPLGQVQRALDDGVSLADSIAANFRRPQPYLWADVVRTRAVEHLLDLPDNADWSFRVLPNNGFEVVRVPFTARLCKAINGGPPSPGHSVARRDYWLNRQFHSYTLFDYPEAPIEQWNLLLDWAITEDRSVVLALSRPMGLWDFQSDPAITWRHAVEPDGDNLGFATQDDLEDFPWPLEDEAGSEGEAIP